MIVLLVVVLGAVLLLSRIGGGGSDLDLVAPEAERELVDLGDSGPSLGDMTVFGGPLLDGDDEAGRIDGVCTVTSEPDDEEERRQRCAVTLTIGDGETELQLAAVGRAAADDVIFSIVGGGGDYAGAGGEAEFDYSGDGRIEIDVSVED